MDGGLTHIPEEARRYALGELCRRAGLAEDDCRRHWRIESGEGGRTLALRAVDPAFGRIDFPALDGALRPELTVRKSWPGAVASSLAETVPDFVVPYARRDSAAGEPVFVEVAPGRFRCTEDLLASTALMLSRYEESLAGQRDAHGRFEAASSMAVRDGYLERPIVDEYGLALQAAMLAIMPGWKPAARKLRVKLSHDVDLIGIPFSLRESAVQMIARRSMGVGLRDLMSGFTPMMPGSLRQVMEICQRAEERGLRSALYWKAADAGPFDSGYSLADARVAGVIAWASERKIEMGVHPGYETFLSAQALREETERCRSALKCARMGGRQHYLRWRPETWAHWEECGLAYDSSVGYADRAGFRAGTCWPYFPWLWNEGRRAEVLEIPLIVMDRTLVSATYMAMSPDESLALLKALMRRCGAVGGVLSVLWHNNCMGHPFSAYYPRIFDALAGNENYDWEMDFDSMHRDAGMR